MKSEADLLEVVAAGTPTRGLTSLLNRREQKTNENTNNCNDDKQFNESEGTTIWMEGHENSPIVQDSADGRIGKQK
jgi:hypothetical protein